MGVHRLSPGRFAVFRITTGDIAGAATWPPAEGIPWGCSRCAGARCRLAVTCSEHRVNEFITATVSGRFYTCGIAGASVAPAAAVPGGRATGTPQAYKTGAKGGMRRPVVPVGGGRERRGQDRGIITP